MNKPKMEKINGLAMCRRIKENMQCIIPKPGYTFGGHDLVSAEACVQCNLTGDSTLIYQTFEGVGKEPYYRADGLLMIDDPYIALTSVNPATRDDVLYAWGLEYGGLPFPEAWVSEYKEKIKSTLKKPRTLNKNSWLALSYGQFHSSKHPKRGLLNNLRDKGFNVSERECKEIYNYYWKIYPGIKAYKDYVSKNLKAGKTVTNPLGYMINTIPKDGYNAIMQSTVSSIMIALRRLVNDRGGEGRKWFVKLVYHDEFISEVKEGLERDYEDALLESLDEINNILGWGYPLRIEGSFGDSFYAIKD